MNPKIFFCHFALTCCIVPIHAQTLQKQNYKPLSEIKANPGVKIGDSELNKFIDTTDIIYILGTLPNEYKRQNLSTGKYYQYFSDDTTKIAFELIYTHNYLTAFKSYWHNDTLRQKGQLVNGSEEGNWFHYHKNGKLGSKFIWSKGVHHEFWFYSDKGILRKHCREPDPTNEKERIWETEDYFANGNLMQTGQTRNGYKTKTWTYYNQDGSLKEIVKEEKAVLPGPLSE